MVGGLLITLLLDRRRNCGRRRDSRAVRIQLKRKKASFQLSAALIQDRGAQCAPLFLQKKIPLHQAGRTAKIGCATD